MILVFVLAVLSRLAGTSSDSQSSQVVLTKGFSASPSSRVDAFQPVLVDQSGNFSLGFLRVNRTGLAIAVLHVASSQPVWTAGSAAGSQSWSDHVEIRFDGNLTLSDSSSGHVYWSAGEAGDRVVLLNNSNLQVQRLSGRSDGSYDVAWQSFDYPTDTLMEGQNFTSGMSLETADGLYSMRLGSDFIGLYAGFSGSNSGGQMYWQHKALEAKADITANGGPIYARVEPDGYLAMYQNSTIPVDVEAFSTYHRNISAFRLLRLEPDGNLKAYYWGDSSWKVDYQAISEFCELPSPCGSYGLCKPGGGGCSCLQNRTDHKPGPCATLGSGNLCSGGSRFTVLRRNGVELPYKQLMDYQTVSSLQDCESACAANCTCHGTVYNNRSGFCYPIYYPVQTLLSVGDEAKVGYLKVSAPHGDGSYKVGVGVGALMSVLVGAVVVGVFGLVGYRVWSRRGVTGYLGGDNGASPGPYKDLASASFRSIELTGK
ncbi:hypothetical protein MLD38_035462 [Melastoma candidum]|nr:hypothetical protein MLD38_035462 [Melastoma candidum]